MGIFGPQVESKAYPRRGFCILVLFLNVVGILAIVTEPPIVACVVASVAKPP
jgi:hypothetical protein